jgi:glycosyltransferase involved in cell wall biosynthesis
VDSPLVSVVLTTRDRPRFLPLALEWYRRQTYSRRELIVVDDGERHPVPAEAVEHLGGRLVRLDAVTALGTKLNLGCEAARGTICVKMDDDDWYAPRYIETMVAGHRGPPTASTCRPTMAFLTPFRFFDVSNWLIRRSDDGNVPGATLVFARENWAEVPFRALSSNEDRWFAHDQRELGVLPRPVTAPDVYLAVRHTGSSRDRGHQWRRQWHGQELDAYLLRRPVEKTPESLLPRWALARYRSLRSELLAEQPQLAAV